MNQPVPDLVGMIHLLALPGSPSFGGSMDEVLTTAASDTALLVDSGFPAVMVENFADVPFLADHVPPETIAAVSLAVAEVLKAGIPVGVNVLRNDGLAALGIAAATGASFIRVNVLTGMMITDQGPIVGRAAEIQRSRQVLGPEIEVWADVLVKHAVAPSGLDARQAASDMVERGLADAVIVSGSGTGAEPDLHEANIVRSAVPETRLVIGSGASESNLDRLLETADSVIVGSHLKFDGDPRRRPDPERLTKFVEKATKHGLI